jgi:CRP-like cAMP-binding protein
VDVIPELLSRVPLFAELEAADLALLAEAMERRSYLEGETVTKEGTPSDEFFVVEAGEAAVTVGDEPRARLQPGDYFGEIALLMGAERTATVKAATDLHCYRLAGSAFRTIVEGNPAIAWELMQTMAERGP